MAEHFNIAVIGSGPGGYVAALKAARLGAKTAIIEKHQLGGTCLNYGCIPSKALLASADLMHRIKNSQAMGVSVNGQVSFDWPAIQARKDKVLTKLRGGIKGLLAAGAVKLYTGKAVFDGPGKIRIADEKGKTDTITADSIIIATGSVPSRIPGWPADTNLVCTSDEALHWTQLPQRLLIVGGGVIGCEFACMMHQFGVRVTVVEMMDNLLPEMETQLGRSLADILVKRGIQIFTSVKVEDLKADGAVLNAVLSNGQKIQVDKTLVATGRKPNTADIGLESAGLQTDRGFIRVNDRMQTAAKNHYCIGDANGRCLLAHAASAQAIVAVENALGHETQMTLPIPGAVYTFPEIASVGLTGRDVQRQNIPASVGYFPIGYLGKAMAVGEETGFVRVIRHRDEKTLLGVHILGHNATEMIHTAVAIMGRRAGANELAEMVFAHPTLGEAVKEAAEDSFAAALHLPPRKTVRLVADLENIE